MLTVLLSDCLDETEKCSSDISLTKSSTNMTLLGLENKNPNKISGHSALMNKDELK